MTAMSPLRTLREGLGDDSLRVAIYLGLATVPFTVALSWDPVSDGVVNIGGSISGEALLLAGLIVGYYYHDRPTEAKRAGIWAGLAGSIGTVIVFGANSSAAVASASWPWSAAAVVLTLAAVGFGVGFTVLLTTVVAMGLDWVLTRLDRNRRTAESKPGDNTSKWWIALAVYAVVAPVALGYLFGIAPESDASVLLSVLLVFSVVILSLPTLVALFVDATAPRSDWLPNVWLYVGGPIVAGVLVYLFATVRGWGFPPGYGQYAFLTALWVATAVYLVNRRRHRTDGPRYGNAA
ncbi:DUF5518 domain-containing protein [Natronobacterium texcoconense]|uniref:Uncharacterized protein n=1 Tax=Natronobacterium texcoconense TaxID=1095778 RepID=A0A1H1HXA1_NATTX|nr:DUF5518 domain-containing protein [Natronobacterium texcoconense]SDR29919.1 hypothetical protein SAMN04489842_3116 [Natronobacterium texcoconense]